jgi:putative PIN family toxin of toxin-antitoxin system
MSESSGKAPRPSLKVVVDTNLFVSGTIFKRGNPFALLEAWRHQQFDLIRSDEQYTELADVFGRPKITLRYGVTNAELVSLFTGMIQAQRAPLSLQLPFPLDDPKDVHILALAVGGDADYLVTGDDDLLRHQGDPRVGKLKIVTAREFLDILDSREQE